jgi:hypothetical protein
MALFGGMDSAGRVGLESAWIDFLPEDLEPNLAEAATSAPITRTLCPKRDDKGMAVTCVDGLNGRAVEPDKARALAKSP